MKNLLNLCKTLNLKFKKPKLDTLYYGFLITVIIAWILVIGIIIGHVIGSHSNCWEKINSWETEYANAYKYTCYEVEEDLYIDIEPLIELKIK